MSDGSYDTPGRATPPEAPTGSAFERAKLWFSNVTGTFHQVDSDGLDTDLGAAGGGETNLGLNVGGGNEVFRDKTGVTLNFRTFVALNASIAVTTLGDVIRIGFGHVLNAALDAAGFEITDIRNASFEAVVAQTTPGGATTLDFSVTQMIRLTVDQNTVVTITPPPGPCTCTLWLVQSGGTNSITTWNLSGGSVLFSGPAVDVPTPDGNEDLVFLKFDGTDIYIGSDGPWT